MALFSIPPSAPFLETAVHALTSGLLLKSLNSSKHLRQATFFVPSQQAAQALKTILSSEKNLYPRILILGQLPEHFESHDIPPSLSSAALQLALVRPLQKRFLEARQSLSFATAYTLSHDLMGFLDALTLHRISWEQVQKVRSQRTSDAFDIQALMLDMVLWDIPEILKNAGSPTAMQRNHQQMERYRQRLSHSGSPYPVIILGSTGSHGETRLLMQQVASLPNGIVILPGVDTQTPEDLWLEYAKHPTHPQMLLSAFTQICGQTRITSLCPPSHLGSARMQLLAHALMPPNKTETWSQNHDNPDIYSHAIKGLAVASGQNERHEASLIAYALHNALLKGAKRPTLITPDRTLADYTALELQRWSHTPHRTAPVALSRTSAGHLALLTLTLIAPELDPTAVSALLAHPWVTLGLTAESYKRCRPLWDRFFLRNIPAKSSITILLTRLHAYDDASLFHERLGSHSKVAQMAYAALETDIKINLQQGLTFFVSTYESWFTESENLSLQDWITRHFILLEALTALSKDQICEQHPESKDLFDLLESFSKQPLRLSRDEYKTLLESAIRQTQVFPSYDQQTDYPIIQIAGLWEARFLNPDYVVLGGVTETIWPPTAPINAFCDRALSAALGLPSPDTRVGQSAHDFFNALCRTPQALITYSRKRNNTPTLPSRFILRLQACLGDKLWALVCRHGEDLTSQTETMHPTPSLPQTFEQKSIPSDIICSDLMLPKTLSVKGLERLIGDSKAFFTHHILGLNPLSDRILDHGPSDYGALLHNIFARFSQDYPSVLPPDPLKVLLSLAEKQFSTLKDPYRSVDVFWWSKFAYCAEAFIEWEKKRRPNIEKILTSIPGRLLLQTDSGPITVTTQTDRIEKNCDGTYTLIDFTTSMLPSLKEIHAGVRLSLILQAAALEHGHLGPCPSTALYDLIYVHISPYEKLFNIRRISPPEDKASLSLFIQEMIARITMKLNTYAP